jgi:hypothetical protein
LDFYERKYAAAYAKLLSELSTHHQWIAFTKSVYDEFRRNRLTSYLRGHPFPEAATTFDVALQSYFSNPGDVAGDELWTELKTLKADAQKVWQHAKALHDKNKEAIQEGSDYVSRAVAPLANSLLEPTDAQLARARLRKELNNPPGKRTDPLGDEIAWEEVLDRAENKDSLWIVSRDGDYSTELNGRRVLRSFLIDEVRARAPSIKVHFHDSLVDFFAEFKTVFEVPQLSDNDAKEDFERATESYAPFPRCEGASDGQHELDVALIPYPSQYGGWSYWQFCKKCGRRFDTGEPCED